MEGRFLWNKTKNVALGRENRGCREEKDKETGSMNPNASLSLASVVSSAQKMLSKEHTQHYTSQALLDRGSSVMACGPKIGT